MAQKMKAAIFKKPGEFKIEEIPIPELKKGWVKVKRAGWKVSDEKLYRLGKNPARNAITRHARTTFDARFWPAPEVRRCAAHPALNRRPWLIQST